MVQDREGGAEERGRRWGEEERRERKRRECWESDMVWWVYVKLYMCPILIGYWM